MQSPLSSTEEEITLDLLSMELLSHIALELEPKDVLNLSLTCKKFSPLINDVNYWHHILGYSKDDEKKLIKEYQEDYVIIKQFQPKDNYSTTTGLSKKDKSKSLPHRRGKKIVWVLVTILLNISWDYISYFCDIIFLILLVLRLDRVFMFPGIIPFLFFSVSIITKTFFPYLAIIGLRYIYGPFFDLAYLPQQNVSVILISSIYLYSSPYIGVMSFFSILIFFFYILVLCYVSNIIGFIFVLIPPFLCAVLAVFSCANFTCLPVYKRAPCSFTKVLYCTIPSCSIVASIILIALASLGDEYVPYYASFLPLYVSSIYEIILFSFTTIYLSCCSNKLLVSDLPCYILLFPCYEKKTVSEAITMNQFLLFLLIYVSIPLAIFLILLSMKLDGFVDVKFLYIFIPFFFLELSIVFFSLAIHIGCCITHGFSESNNYKLHNNEEDISSFDEQEMDTLPPAVIRGKKLNLPHK
ncbi:F-box domain containing membrane protein [Entamoeba histolytica HM-3:IMSS]|uniref:F-box domain containing membrane protein, putative n=4 Tax=Entamoeba histolytica TaxID=5759 RepID=C4M9H8_ENTH1|nr:F-box domain containing membrane protein, putative [Entamoeba histolytica HM-1:IMSS]EAL43692.1 F-box domain containing membrane protein, putative [Entamoeba histolytica HM-1:IMSS]EMD45776.1 F-box domain membrane protein [Entamoeba histolytica KU27]EMS15340.1 F-box domain containing membrane protein [Entamoeba histolytica HM-3:IMSS]GAT98322.1 f-box domain containing membrane protein putative [Entamoeba histolytica]|eukprot:XP_649079.1 F-box domain containing membrane protein, putative [Entamoeba histolytica HM-1:IMSS]